MTRIIKVVFIIVTGLFISSISYCETITIEELVDQYQHATDLQKRELETRFIGTAVTASGVVENVGEYNFFDINTDTGEKYYKVMTQQQETAGKTPYQVVFLYKNADRLKNVSKGFQMEKEGIIINIVDERLQISVWLYEDELTARDKLLFRM